MELRLENNQFGFVRINCKPCLVSISTCSIIALTHYKWIACVHYYLTCTFLLITRDYEYSVIISHVRATLIWCFLSPVIKIGFRIATTKRVTLNYNIHYVIRLFHDYIEFCGVWKTLANLSYWNRQMKFLIMKCIICENLLCSRFDFKMN